MVNGMVTQQPDLTDELYADAALHDPQGPWQMIFGVATRPDCQRQGHAATLLRRAIQDSRARGKQGLVLTCKDRLVHYYAQFGFVSEGVSVSQHGGGGVVPDAPAVLTPAPAAGGLPVDGAGVFWYNH